MGKGRAVVQAGRAELAVLVEKTHGDTGSTSWSWSSRHPSFFNEGKFSWHLNHRLRWNCEEKSKTIQRGLTSVACSLIHSLTFCCFVLFTAASYIAKVSGQHLSNIQYKSNRTCLLGSFPSTLESNTPAEACVPSIRQPDWPPSALKIVSFTS